jgi:hypothetical protein
MSVPIVLMMDASILTRDGVGYSNRKLAHYDARPLFDEQAFDSIEFSDVYHEGPTGGRDRVIQDRRMAEVVVPGHLELNNCLRHVVCRTRLDEITLRQLAARAPENVISKIRVAQNPTDFFLCRDTFISHLEYVDASLFLKLFQGRNYTGGKRVRCQIFQHINGALVKQADFEEVINNTGVRVGPFERSAASVWRILIEEVLAFEGQLPYGTSEIARP